MCSPRKKSSLRLCHECVISGLYFFNEGLNDSKNMQLLSFCRKHLQSVLLAKLLQHILALHCCWSNSSSTKRLCRFFSFWFLPAEIRDDKNGGHPSPGEFDFLHQGGERHRPKHPLLPQVQLHQRGSYLLAFQR